MRVEVLHWAAAVGSQELRIVDKLQERTDFTLQSHWTQERLLQNDHQAGLRRVEDAHNHFVIIQKKKVVAQMFWTRSKLQRQSCSSCHPAKVIKLSGDI